MVWIAGYVLHKIRDPSLIAMISPRFASSMKVCPDAVKAQQQAEKAAAIVNIPSFICATMRTFWSYRYPH